MDDPSLFQNSMGSLGGAEIFVGPGADGGHGPGNEDGTLQTSGITMMEEEGGGGGGGRYSSKPEMLGGGAGADYGARVVDADGHMYEDQYVDDQGGYGHQNPAAYSNHPEVFHHERQRQQQQQQRGGGAAGHGGEDALDYDQQQQQQQQIGGRGGDGNGRYMNDGGYDDDNRGGGYVNDQYDDDEDNYDIGFDGSDLPSQRSLSQRSYTNQDHRQVQQQQQQQQQALQQQKRQAEEQTGHPEYYTQPQDDGYPDHNQDTKYDGDEQPQLQPQDDQYDDENQYDLPCISLASYELDTMRFTQRRHVSFLEHTQSGKRGGGQGGQQATLQDFSDIPLPSRQSFPEDCLQVLRLLDCNGGCVDCGAGSVNGQGEPPMWASISHGTLLCDKCAFLHITRSEEKAFKHMSLVKHLNTGYWTLPEILTMLEGGNGNFLLAVQGNRHLRRPMAGGLERKGGQRLGDKSNNRLGLGDGALAPIEEEADAMGGGGIAGNGGLGHSGLFEARYKSKPAATYCAMLQRRVAAVCSAFECDLGLPFDVSRQDVHVTDFVECPNPAKVKLRDPPSIEEIRWQRTDASRTASLSTGRMTGGSTYLGSSRSSAASSRNLSSVARSAPSSRNLGSGRGAAPSSRQFGSTRRLSDEGPAQQPTRLLSGAKSAKSMPAKSSRKLINEGSQPYSRRHSSEGPQRSTRQLNNKGAQKARRRVSNDNSQPSVRRVSNDASQQGSMSSTATGPENNVAAPSSPARRESNACSSRESAPPAPALPTKMARRVSDPARVPDCVQEKKDKLKRQARRAKKQDRRRRTSL